MLKKLLFIIVAGGFFLYCAPKTEKFQEGDIVFQSTQSRQSKAIELATHSRFSHVGMIIENDGKLVVAEAVQPVKFTSIENWITQGGGKFTQSRIKNADKILTENVKMKMRNLANSYAGKNYDLYFEWSDDKLYCSELVWKIYKNAAGIEVGKIRKFKEYDFTHPVVKQQLKERFGNNIPMEENIVSPEDIYKSDLLVEVK
ncbi:MAG: YiiX family permuted papain-like enzyme [Sphingobacteriales bacterium]|nr:MAG: YiiX family permuted papain-like enzyme [Sphingobacteriales bacterium]